jgi:5-methylcytosine-specific restriction endonuclease McrA
MAVGATSRNGVPATQGSVAGGRTPGSSRVLVLNATYEPINVCTVRRATVLVLKSKAEIIERGRGRLHSERLALERPVVIRLITYVRVPRDVHRRKITRKAVLARDSWTCQYCGASKPGLTVDHVIPRSRGGESVWENIVASCAACNRKKGSQLPREARMHPRRRPKPPGPTVFIRIAAPKVPVAWERYLVLSGAGSTPA